jgi:hypothetical protein
LTFDRLCEALPPRTACKTMVELLSLAHERTCEAQLADALNQCLAQGQLPDLNTLRACRKCTCNWRRCATTRLCSTRTWR